MYDEDGVCTQEECVYDSEFLSSLHAGIWKTAGSMRGSLWISNGVSLDVSGRRKA